MSACKVCGSPVPAEGRAVCSTRCRAILGGRARLGYRRKREDVPDCPHCRSGRMPLVGGVHRTADGRVYQCKPRVPNAMEAAAQSEPVEAPIDVHAALQDAVDRETAPPWVRHPVPWDNVVVRRPAAAVRP